MALERFPPALALHSATRADQWRARVARRTLKGMFEERARAVAALAAGRSSRAVARIVGCAPETIMRWYRADRPDDPAAVAAGLAFLAEGWSVLDVAEAAGVPRSSVRRWLRDSKR